jgi:hypothetical protein
VADGPVALTSSIDPAMASSAARSSCRNRGQAATTRARSANSTDAPGKFHSFLGYYEPARIIQNGAWPMTDIACLLALGITAWLLALSIFERRDISTT